MLCGYYSGVKNKNVSYNRCPHEQDNDCLRSTLKKTKCEVRTHEFGGRLKIRQQLPLLKFFEAKPGTCFLINIFSLDGRIWANEANSCHNRDRQDDVFSVPSRPISRRKFSCHIEINHHFLLTHCLSTWLLFPH